MKLTDIQDCLRKLFVTWSGQEPEDLVMLPPSGSSRRYFRLKVNDQSAIGVFNPDTQENQIFIYFSRHFRKSGVPVPDVYEVHESELCYLISDLGDTTLLRKVFQIRKVDGFNRELANLYKDVIKSLIHMQIEGAKGLNFDICKPRKSFDRQSILWDLNAFKYHFLRLAGIIFDEQKLETEFNQLADFLMQAESKYFMFRDFQARNIMMIGDKAWFIDYQGGRRGPLQYDLASLLFQARADIPGETREELLDFYIQEAGRRIQLDPAVFKSHYYGFVLIRSLQVLAVYGWRGLHERKSHFLTSIPYALKNLQWLLSFPQKGFTFPYLEDLLSSLTGESILDQLPQEDNGQNTGLTVVVRSFSFLMGVPDDKSGHGGGFIFDCRGLNNPGRFIEFKDSTGRDEDVIRFFKEKSRMDEFVANAFSLVDLTVETYLERGFRHLSVGFGCTGGQHRSVYAADQMARHLKDKFGVAVKLNHVEMERKKKRGFTGSEEEQEW